MRLRTLAALTATAQSALAFRDTSPFFLFSTSTLPSESSHLKKTDSITTAAKVSEHLTSILHGCPTESYVIVNQPGVSASDFEEGVDTINLYRYLNGRDPRANVEVSQNIKTTQSIRSVIGDISATGLEGKIRSICGSHTTSMTLGTGLLPKVGDGVHIITVELQEVKGTAEERHRAMARDDSYLNQLLKVLERKGYTVIYGTTPPKAKGSIEEGVKDDRFASVDQKAGQHAYQMDEPYPSSVKANHFKRDINAYPRAANETNVDVALFEKYQFLSSGIFMGIFVSILLLSILYVGLSAVSGLEVSYMAFSKEMNPSAQKKQ